jgi:aminobenzoyl-glutamate utilization protein B
VACFPLEIPGHSWGVVTCSGSPVGNKGMQIAAKILAATAIDFLLNPGLIQEAQKEFKEKTRDFVYKCSIPVDQKPRTGKKQPAK